jgi:hypothetical protein
MLWRPLAMVDRQYADERDDGAMVNFVARMMPGAVKLSMVRRPMTARRCPGAWYVACYVIGQADSGHRPGDFGSAVRKALHEWDEFGCRGFR